MKEKMRININEAVAQTKLPGKTLEETRKWKIEKKSLYSVPHPKRTFDELQQKFPDGRVEEGKFIVDIYNNEGVLIRRVFDTRGYEVERSTYGKGISKNEADQDKSLKIRLTSIYDEDGYLAEVIEMHTGETAGYGYIREIAYEPLEVNLSANRNQNISWAIKVPKYILTQDVLSVPTPEGKSLRNPGWPVTWKPPIILSFTDVPYIQPSLKVGV